MAEAAGPADPGQTTTTPPAGTPAPEATSPPTLVGGDGTTLLDWRSRFPEDLRNHSVLQQFPHPEGAAKTLVSQAEMLGRALFVPREDATPEQQAEAYGKVYTRLGRPADSTGYSTATRPETLPEGLEFDAEFVKGLKEVAYDAGLNQAQFQKLLHFSGQTIRQSMNSSKAQEAQSRIEGQKALAREFGASAGRIEQEAQLLFEEFGRGAFGGERGIAAWQAFQEAKLPDGTPLANVPAVAYAFSQMYQKLGEGVFLDGDLTMAGVNTAEAIEKQFQDLTAKRHSPGGLTAQEERQWDGLSNHIVRNRERQQQQGGGRRVA